VTTSLVETGACVRVLTEEQFGTRRCAG